MIRYGNAHSNSDTLFNATQTLCGAAPGFVHCPRGDAVRSCCCSWTPSALSCSGPFNASNHDLLARVVTSHFAHSPSARRLATPQQAARACPWFDRGMWHLPQDFIDLDFDAAAAASARAAGGAVNVTPGDVAHEKRHRRNVGPLFVWRLARELRALARHVTPLNASASSGSAARTSGAGGGNASEYASPGMLIISGDSIVRQVFARLVHAVRSRECSDEREMFRGGVFERYFHLSAAYVVTTRGDALALDWPACEVAAREPLHSSLVPGGGRVLLRVCYVWDNTADASAASFGTEFAIVHTAKHTPVAAVVYWPTMHHCNYAGGKCGDANVSNAAVLTVLASATRHGVPRVAVATTIERQWYPFYFSDMIAQRNAQLRALFGVDAWPRVRSRLDPNVMARWRRAAGSNSSYDAAPLERGLYRAMGGGATVGARFRMYDFAVRHTAIAPRQCDHGHSMCMFWPLRLSAAARHVVNGISGICPNGSRCEDPWNFLVLHEALTLLFA